MPAIDSTEPSVRVLRQFRILFNAVRTHFREVERTAGIGGAQLWALSVIGQRPGIGVSELARALDIHQTTASNLVKALVEQALIATQPSETDRRAVALSVTLQGKRILKSAPTPFSGVLPAALQKMTPKQLARLEKDLGALIVEVAPKANAARTPLADL
ncbi:MarR family transcriptional regulator [Pseudoduganella sp. DS3]|uniref:MarR family transcriptional regulator n=1 Tax=Pseudoduganella guangdongensis TaxID=2692179 RepID=A0A6N9HLD2_9BURK|nr:MarR family transcriptional regulator [Pseudoduganella guangdongensis]MYN04057.1 MarR family transcriptional regulator [Pseudoduganella guangdongensis]